MAEQICSHIRAIADIKMAEQYVCEACVKMGGKWVHLRTCQTCGITLCCDDSPATHMTKHYNAMGHPVISSAEPGEKWLWCYEDESFVEFD